MNLEEIKREIADGWPHNLEEKLILAGRLRELQREAMAAAGPALPPEEIEAIAQRALDPAGELDTRLHNPAVVAAVVAYLDRKVYQVQWQEGQAALIHGEAMVRVGKFGGDDSAIALGLMTQADTLIQLGNRIHSAWDFLSQAAECFLRDGNLVGWARTCTGRLGISIETGHVEEGLENAYIARRILEYFKENEYYVRLAINLMFTANGLGRYQENILVFEQTLPIARQLGEDAEHHLALLYNNAGLAYLYRGQFHSARRYFEEAEALFIKHRKLAGRDAARLNMAYIDMGHGNHKAALRILHQLLGSMANPDTLYGVHVKMDMTECYLYLNRNQEALDMAREIVQSLSRISMRGELPNDLAQTHCHLAAAQIRLGQYNAAEQNLKLAIRLFSSFGALPWERFATLLLAEIAALQGDYAQALALTTAPQDFFREQKQLVQQTRTLLVRGQSFLALGRMAEALAAGMQAMKLARQINSPLFRYRAHFLLGQIQVQAGRRRRGMLHLRAAMTAIRRLQDYLTVTLRADFMGDKSEAFHAYMPLALAGGEIADAFQVLEQSKGQLYLDYIRHQRQDTWRLDDPTSQELIGEFNQWREKHHFFYRQVHERTLLKDDDPRLPVKEVEAELQECERRMKSLAEQLYLRGGGDEEQQAANPAHLALIQQQLMPGTVLIAFYAREDSLWAFVVNREAFTAVPLNMRIGEIDNALEKLHFNLACAIQAGRQSVSFLWVAKQLGKKLFSGLFQPLRQFISVQQRVIIIPYGVLHYVPFNILQDGDAYFIENHELVLMPAASLMTREPPRRPAGALVLAHSYEGRLPHVHQEAAVVAGQMPAAVFAEDESRRDCLGAAPVQVLHIAAHGKQRLDHPELSYVQLADGQLFTDDLLQNDLSYELVVLSACETGRAVVKAGDELIGLGRGVLSAGAGALVASMWPVEDEMTTQLMAGFYEGLTAGKSKAAALRETQLHLLQTYPQLHPAFWGAFQLVGNPRPLSN